MRVRGWRVLPLVRFGPRRASPPTVVTVPEKMRRVLAKRWLEDARAEYASVPAFEHLARALVVAGAPCELVAWATRAAREEEGHATMCFAIASAYADRTLAASRLPFAPSWARRCEPKALLLERLASESLFDGCIEEWTAARSAEEGARQATDPTIRRVLGVIAKEEASHAALARAIVAWAVREEPSLLPILLARLESAQRRRSRSCRANPEKVDDNGPRAVHGWVSFARVGEFAREAYAAAQEDLATLGGVIRRRA
jgi:hypothetical protein